MVQLLAGAPGTTEELALRWDALAGYTADLEGYAKRTYSNCRVNAKIPVVK